MSILSEVNVDLTHSDLDFIFSLSETVDRISVAIMTLAEETDPAIDFILECGDEDCDDPDCDDLDPDDYEDDEFDLDDFDDDDIDYSDDAESIDFNDLDLDDLEGDYNEYF